MPFQPFIRNISTGRAYYGPAMGSGGSQPVQWTNTEQQPAYPTNRAVWNTFKFGAAAGAIFGAGFIPFRGGNIWDKYLGGLRAAEEYSPSGILRTLQLSNFFSSYASGVRNANLFITPELLAKNTLYQDYLSRLIGNQGVSFGRLGTEGVTFRQGQLFYGQGQEVALKYASALVGSGFGATQRIGEGYARILNLPGNLEEGLSPIIGGMPAQIIGGQTRTQAAYRRAGALGTELVGRFNRLLNTPFEIEFLKRSVGKYLNLGVKPSGGARMLGKLSAKYGLALGGLTLGYQSADYFLRNSPLFNDTIFDEGATAGLATFGVRGKLLASQVAEVTGLHAYREKQEEIAPGSTELQKLAAFPLMGSMFMGFSAYAMRVYEMFKLQRTQPGPWGGKPMPAAMARKAVEDSMKEWGGKSLLSRGGKYLASRLPGKMGPVGIASLVGAGLGALAALPFLPGALVPGERPDELKDLYSGRKEVAVRKGRWWTFGRTPYEGDRILYFRPHWYARMRQRSREKSIWGDDEPTPLEKWYKREFTYELEQRHYKDRPYPITGLPFEDVPLIGPVLANTLGRMIKPPRLMHTEEWMGPGGATRSDYPRFGERTATELGQTPGGTPVSPYSPLQTAGEQIYRMTEMIGLPGFLASTIKEKLTGSEDWFDKYKQLESSRRIDGMERWYWDQELGDMFMTNEALRRLYPHRRRQIDLYNPIRNTMPTWLPGPGDKSPDFLHGDPYTKVQEGELRLPGRGYEARFPELEGVSPEDYPIMHKLRVLADVAPYSDKFGEMLGQARKIRHTKVWTAGDEELWKNIMIQTKERKSGKEFHEYKYLTPMGDIFAKGQKEESSDLMSEINRRLATNQKEPGLFKRLLGGYWELLAHNAETSLDMITPLSPGSKLVHMRTPIEAYERERVYGTAAGFWQRPMHDFIEPFFRSLGHELGYQGVPGEIKKERSVTEYFDMLKYIKAARLSNLALHAHDQEGVAQFEKLKDQTLFGINPFTRSYESLLRALPKAERDYFGIFEKADTEEERKRIHQLVPDNEKALYRARWKLADADKIRKAKKKGLLSEEQLQRAEEHLDEFYKEAETEGLPNNKELWAEYLATRQKGENYPDWYRRVYLLSSQKVPGPDWVGWHPSVDLEDIKLKLVQTLGEDIHDYDLWESREKQLPYKPYIDEESVRPLLESQKLSKRQMHDRIKQVLASEELDYDTFITSAKRPTQRTELDIEVESDRSDEIRESLNKMT